MKRINLRKLYPFYYKEDCYIEVTDEVAAQLEQADREENTYERRKRRYKAFYSLDIGNGIESDILFVQASPTELYERKITNEELYSAMSLLSEKQAKRIYAHYFLNMSITKIAQVEGAAKSTISGSIQAGLKQISKKLKNF